MIDILYTARVLSGVPEESEGLLVMLLRLAPDFRHERSSLGPDVLEIRVGGGGDGIGSVREKMEGWPPRRWPGLLRCMELLWGGLGLCEGRRR